MYTGSEVVVLILCAPAGALVGYLLIKWQHYKRDQKLRALVAGLMAEWKEERKHLVACKHCLYGKTWRPEVIARNFPIDSDEPWMEDCEYCGGEGFVPKVRLKANLN